MKIKIIGIERSKGTSAKTQKAYDMATIHTITKLAPRAGDNDLSKGYMGDSIRVPSELIRKIEHLEFPLDAELVAEDVMRFGKREVDVSDIRPIEAPKQLKAA